MSKNKATKMLISLVLIICVAFGAYVILNIKNEKNDTVISTTEYRGVSIPKSAVGKIKKSSVDRIIENKENLNDYLLANEYRGAKVEDNAIGVITKKEADEMINENGGKGEGLVIRGGTFYED